MAAEHFNTTVVDNTSAEFTPDGETVLVQVESTKNCIVEILGKVHADADFQSIEVLRWPITKPVELRAFPLMKIRVRGNEPGNSVDVWVV